MAKTKDTISFPKSPKDLERMKVQDRKNAQKQSEIQRRTSEAAKKK